MQHEEDEGHEMPSRQRFREPLVVADNGNDLGEESRRDAPPLLVARPARNGTITSRVIEKAMRRGYARIVAGASGRRDAKNEVTHVRYRDDCQRSGQPYHAKPRRAFLAQSPVCTDAAPFGTDALCECAADAHARSHHPTGGMPILVLTTTGRKSGKVRSTPVGYLRHGDALAVLASNAGSDHTPAWWLNLVADPRAEVLVEGERRAVRARRADDGEEVALWAIFARLNPGFDEYRRLTERRIPVILLEPCR